MVFFCPFYHICAALCTTKSSVRLLLNFTLDIGLVKHIVTLYINSWDINTLHKILAKLDTDVAVSHFILVRKYHYLVRANTTDALLIAVTGMLSSLTPSLSLKHFFLTVFMQINKLQNNILH